MANNIAAFATEIKSVFTSTTNLDAGTKTKLRTRLVAAYKGEWDARVAAGTVNNTANQTTFAIDKIVDFMKAIYKAESHKENTAALPASDVLT